MKVDDINTPILYTGGEEEHGEGEHHNEGHEHKTWSELVANEKFKHLLEERKKENSKQKGPSGKPHVPEESS